MSSAVAFMIERLNKVKYSVRASQAIVQYSIGSMVDFPDQTLMPAAPEQWAGSVERIHDERLERLLHVQFFGMPGSNDLKQFSQGIHYTRFPEWYFCPKCRRLQSLSDWIRDFRRLQPKRAEKDPYMIRTIKCPKDHIGLVVARIITVCPDGHIDDFPWVQWAHARSNRPICATPKMSLRSSPTASEGLEGITVLCETCMARASLAGVFSPGMLQAQEKASNGQICFRCRGRHPWKNTKEACAHYPRVMQRGASTVYFPVIESSLVIPPFSSKITTKVENSEQYKELLVKITSSLDVLEATGLLTDEMKVKTIQNLILKQANSIAISTLIPEDQVIQVLERKLLNGESNPKSEDAETTQSLRYRIEEFEALSSESPDANMDDGDFHKELVAAEKYGLPYVKSISLIHKIREVEAMIGFTRIKPASREAGAKDEPKIVNIKESGTQWYPAYQIRGEGIFVEFDGEKINDFVRKSPQICDRENHIDRSYRAANGSPIKKTAKYIILHTLAHLLIKQLSFECGYGISSLKERIYCSNAEDGKEMAGILIYTANGDSEGTLGGLVRQGHPDSFPRIFRKAVESALICSNDPVCSMSKGQGRDSINLAACYACTLIPETSCERNNLCLDRGVIVGNFADHSFGLYSPWLNGNHSREDNTEFRQVPVNAESIADSREEPGAKVISKKKMTVASYGLNLKTGKYFAIWKQYAGFAETKESKAVYLELQKNSEKFEGLEKPFQDAELITEDNISIACDLLWKNAKVLFFTESSRDEYEAAVDTDWKCICVDSHTDVVKELLNALKGEQ